MTQDNESPEKADGDEAGEHVESKWKHCFNQVPAAALKVVPENSYPTIAEFEKDIVAQLDKIKFKWPRVKDEKLSHIKSYMRRRIRRHLERTTQYPIEIKRAEAQKVSTESTVSSAQGKGAKSQESLAQPTLPPNQINGTVSRKDLAQNPVVTPASDTTSHVKPSNSLPSIPYKPRAVTLAGNIPKSSSGNTTKRPSQKDKTVNSGTRLNGGITTPDSTNIDKSSKRISKTPSAPLAPQPSRASSAIQSTVSPQSTETHLVTPTEKSKVIITGSRLKRRASPSTRKEPGEVSKNASGPPTPHTLRVPSATRLPASIQSTVANAVLPKKKIKLIITGPRRDRVASPSTKKTPEEIPDKDFKPLTPKVPRVSSSIGEAVRRRAGTPFPSELFAGDDQEGALAIEETGLPVTFPVDQATVDADNTDHEQTPLRELDNDASNARSRRLPQREARKKSQKLDFSKVGSQKDPIPSDSSASDFADSSPAIVDGNYETCSKCGKGGKLVCCETCPRAYHPRCLIGGVPEDEFYCNVCMKAKESDVPGRKRKRTTSSSTAHNGRGDVQSSRNSDDDVIKSNFDATQHSDDEDSGEGEPRQDEESSEGKPITAGPSHWSSVPEALPVQPSGGVELFRRWELRCGDGIFVRATWDAYVPVAAMYRVASDRIRLQSSLFYWTDLERKKGGFKTDRLSAMFIPLARAEKLAEQLECAKRMKPLFWVLKRTLERTGEMIFTCSVCKKVCSNPTILTKHFVEAHSQSATSICLCGKGFNRIATHTEHLESCADYKLFIDAQGD